MPFGEQYNFLDPSELEAYLVVLKELLKFLFHLVGWFS